MEVRFRFCRKMHFWSYTPGPRGFFLKFFSAWEKASRKAAKTSREAALRLIFDAEKKFKENPLVQGSLFGLVSKW